jgi:hypothetical protein
MFGIIFLMLLVLLLRYCLLINKLTLITLGISFLLVVKAGVLSARATRKDKS